MANVLWKLPVPSTALFSGVSLEKRLRHDVALRFSYESGDDARLRDCSLVFGGVEAFKCTYYFARDDSMREAYDQLVDRGKTAWLAEVSANLESYGENPDGLTHLMINFDDGPCYEFIGRTFRVEEA